MRSLKLIITAAPALLVAFVYVQTQERIAYGDGHPYSDGTAYFELAKQASAGLPLQAQAPYSYRLALPYLAGKLFPSDILNGFALLNYASGVVAIVGLLLLCLKYNIKTAYIVLALLLYAANPQSPFRYCSFYPAFTDAPSLAIMVYILLMFKTNISLRAKVVFIGVLSFVGVLFREIVVAAPLALLLVVAVEHWRRRGHRGLADVLWYSVPVVAGAIGVALTRLMSTGTGGFTFLNAVVYTAKARIDSPLVYPASALVAFGPVVFIVLFGLLKEGTRGFAAANPELISFGALVLGLAVIGGPHTVERYIYWSFPAFYLVLAYVIDNNSVELPNYRAKLAFYAPIAVAQCFAHGYFAAVPNASHDVVANPGNPAYVIFMAMGENSNFAQNIMSIATPATRITVLAEYAALFAYLAVVVLATRRGDPGGSVQAPPRA